MNNENSNDDEMLFLFSSDKLEDYLALALAATLLIAILTLR